MKNIKAKNRLKTRLLMVLAALVVFSASSALANYVGFKNYYSGLPADYQASGWQSPLYYFTQYPLNGSTEIIADGIITIGNDKYLCVGWSSGTGDVPESGNSNRMGTIANTTQSSVVWIYEKAQEVSVDIDPFDQRLYGWGYNYGQVGVPPPSEPGSAGFVGSPLPEVGGRTDWISASSTYYHTAAVKKDGTLWAFGRNFNGECGVDPNTAGYVVTPTQVGTDNDWTAASAGAEFTVAIKRDGTMYSWGTDGGSQGRLGHGPGVQITHTPIRIGKDADWASVSAGYNHALAIKKDGTLWAWGENDYGRLGAVDNTANNNIQSPLRVGNEDDWAAVSAGGAHTLALKKDGSLWAWGRNDYGQVGNGSTVAATDWSKGVWSPVKIMDGYTWRSIENGAGNSCSLAVRSDGSLWAWGYNQFAELGLGNFDDKSTPTRVGTAADWAMASVGNHASAGVKEDGSIWVWSGDGDNINTGLGTWWGVQKTVPTQIKTTKHGWLNVDVGHIHMVALRSHDEPEPNEEQSWKKVWGWGEAGSGQLGLGPDSADQYAWPQQTSGDFTDWKMVSSGEDHTMAVKEDGTLWAWGSNSGGKLGLGLNPGDGDVFSPTQVGIGADWASVSAGVTFTIALKKNGTIWAWGGNQYGQQGDPAFDVELTQITPKQIGELNNWVAVEAGHSHALAINNLGELWAWGLNISGELGLGHEDSPVLEPTRVGSATDWSAVSAAWNHTLALKTNGELWGWGRNHDGEVGFGGFPGNDFPNQLTPVRVAEPNTFKFVAAGGRSSLAVDMDGKLWAWGQNDDGQLGLGDRTLRYAPAQVGTAQNWAAASTNISYNLTEVPVSHSMAINSDGELFAWGEQNSGILGLGIDMDPPLIPFEVKSPEGNWTTVSVGGTHTVAIRSTAPESRIRFEAKPFLGSGLFKVGENASSSVKAVPLAKNPSSYFLGNWKDGYGDAEETGTETNASFGVTQDSGLKWQYFPLDGLAGLEVSVGEELPFTINDDGVADAGFQPGPGTFNYPLGAENVFLSAPKIIRFENEDGEAERWRCIGWVGTGSVPETGEECVYNIENLTADSAIVWQYKQIANDEVAFNVILPPEDELAPAAANGSSWWAEADVKMYEQTGIPNKWRLMDEQLEDPDDALWLKAGETVKMTASFEVETLAGFYKNIGIEVAKLTEGMNTPVIVQNRQGELMEFIINIPPAPVPEMIFDPEDPTKATTIFPELEMEILLKYKSAAFAPMGSPIALAADPSKSMDERLTEFVKENPSDSKDNAFFHDEDANELYPVRPVPYFEIDGDGYYSDWPKTAVDAAGVVANVPVRVQPDGSSYKYEEIHYSESYDYEMWILTENIFQPPMAGKNLMRFSTLDGEPRFIVVEVVEYSDPTEKDGCTIGTQLSEPTHNDPESRNGYVYNEQGLYDGALTEADQRGQAHVRETRIGPIIPVNTDDPADPADDMVVVWNQRGAANTPAAAIGWPVTIKKYDCRWPESVETIVIASGKGSGPLPEYKAQGKVYCQPDDALPGYNLNEEHALIMGGSLFAIRNDLNTYKKEDGTWVGPLSYELDPVYGDWTGSSDHEFTSEPYVLLKYKVPETNEWAMDVYHVVAEETEDLDDDGNADDLDGDGALSTFNYQIKVGGFISPVTPLNLLPPANKQGETTVSDGDEWQLLDQKNGRWAKGACSEGVAPCDSTIKMQWWYPLQTGFYYPDATKVEGDAVPLLYFREARSGPFVPPPTTVDVSYTTYWPAEAPTLPIGETVTKAKYGLPSVSSMALAEIVFDENRDNMGGDGSAVLFDPFAARSVTLLKLPNAMSTETKLGKVYFNDLPEALRSRLFYDPVAKELRFKGVEIDFGIGEPMLLANTMSAREFIRIKTLPGANAAWASAATALHGIAKNPYIPNYAGATMALSAGMANGEGYVVLAENNHADISSPVQIHVIKVGGGPYRGDIKVIDSDNPFDEKLTLRHSGDFGGQVDKVYFKWYYKPDASGLPPKFPGEDLTGWTPFGEEGWGVNDITIEGPGLLTLSDNWFIVRYYYGHAYPSLTASSALGPDAPPAKPDDPNNWSPWAGAPGGETAQLAQGWIKRVVSKLNPLDARVRDFRNNETNTDVSMLTQLGERREGDIALNGSPDNLNNIGLIEAYGAVLDRGKDFSIEAVPAADYGPANVALLNAATRISGFYTLLGNEAYADAQDPTIGWDSKTGEQGFMASSLFAFRNQLDSLLEEELALLRGRDDSMSTTKARPVYNRLIWNFTNGEGEVAYQQTYNLSDMDTSGVIDELDAKEMYPQGHGDAWGHYLTAMKTWYSLLRHSSYTWEPRIESVLVGGAPVPVDYLDERKFAETAAAKARAAAEIVDLTYRKNYVADEQGQWQGYKDTDPDRAWGVDDWARRAGQGAYFDWVAASAMLPAVDPNPDHAGIQKIDRTTVMELREIPSQYHAIQWQLDEADAGLNPLGLADGVVAFDIDPTFLEVGSGMQGETHFDQIYGRALTALQNASDAFDFANQYTMLTRGNEDELAGFKVGLMEQEREYNNRLIEIFGYPYSGQIGGGKTYPEGYDGPDLLQFMYMKDPSIPGFRSGMIYTTQTITVDWQPNHWINGVPNFEQVQALTVDYPIETDGPWMFTPPTGWGGRRAPGEIQTALSDLLSAQASYNQGLNDLDAIFAQIRAAKNILKAKYNISNDSIATTDSAMAAINSLNYVGWVFAEIAAFLETGADFAGDLGDAISQFVPATKVKAEAEGGAPTTMGVTGGAQVEVTKPAEGAARLTGTIVKFGLGLLANISSAVNDLLGTIATSVELARDRDVMVDEARFELQQMIEELATMHYDAGSKILELVTLGQAMEQAMGSYQAALAQGQRLLDERETFRKLTAGDIQEYRYQDLAFRTFRNDAVQKYRATFDLAARYAYLAATAYDFETNMLGSENAAGQHFLTDIVRRRSPGVIVDGVPVAGDSGLSDPLARLGQNYAVYDTQLGINNPQMEENVFSLRSELFRIRPDSGSDSAWRAELKDAFIADLNNYPPFEQHCRPFAAKSAGAQPGLAIPFSTEINFGQNFFGWPLGAGDSAFDPSLFSTKIFGAGVSFEGYENAGLSNTPRVYLIPVGADIQRSPTDEDFVTRRWKVVDQKLPAPFPISEADFANPTLIPMHDLLSDEFKGIRKHSSFRAHYDGGDNFNASDMTLDLRLVGRSVWNTQWLLIIPGGTLLDNPQAGRDAFLDNVTDIRLTLSTYGFSGN